MNNKDKGLKYALGATIDELAEALGVTRSAVTNGLYRATEKRSYLNAERIQKILKWYLDNKPDIYSLKEAAIKNILGLEILEKNSKWRLERRSVHPIRREEVNELWVITSYPFELRDPLYLEEMEAAVFENPENKIVYFISDVSKAAMLASKISKRFESRKIVKYPQVAILFSDSITMTPHLSVFNPMTKPECFVHCDIPEVGFIRIPDTEALRIVDTVTMAIPNNSKGLTFDEDSNEVIHTSLDGRVTFKNVYISRWEN